MIWIEYSFKYSPIKSIQFPGAFSFEDIAMEKQIDIFSINDSFKLTTLSTVSFN